MAAFFAVIATLVTILFMGAVILAVLEYKRIKDKESEVKKAEQEHVRRTKW